MALGVVQKSELGLPCELFECQGHGQQPCRRFRLLLGQAQRLQCQFAAGLGHGEQMAAQVAAVYRGHIHRQQWRAALGVVPVHEVAAVALQPCERRQGRLQSCQQLRGRNPAERACACRAQQIQADVGGRCPVRQHVVRQRLQVIRRQMVVVRSDATLEEAPGVARDGQQLGAVLRRQGTDIALRTGSTGQPGPHRRRGPCQTQDGCQHRMRRMQNQQCAQQQGGRGRLVPMLAQQGRQRRLRQGLGGLCSRPLQQVAPANGHAIERARDGVQRQHGLLLQLPQMPRYTPYRARKSERRLAVEMAHGHPILAGPEPSHCAHQRSGAERRQHQSQTAPGRYAQTCQRQQQEQQRHRCDE